VPGGQDGVVDLFHGPGGAAARAIAAPAKQNLAAHAKTTIRAAAAHPCLAVPQSPRPSRSAEYRSAITDGSVWKQPDSLCSRRRQILGSGAKGTHGGAWLVLTLRDRLLPSRRHSGPRRDRGRYKVPIRHGSNWLA
jgi:hypothetical protein